MLTNGLVAVKKTHPNEERAGARRERLDPTVEKAAVHSAPFPKISGLGVHAVRNLDKGSPYGGQFSGLKAQTGKVHFGNGEKG